ncbi:MAG TPA: hypothetical protein VNQ55_05760 [Parapedobacter sp.]|nr:hypothetical protein [Parapedobacter sp.]
MENNKQAVEFPAAGKPTLYDRIKDGLAVAGQLIIASPVKLPPKVVAVAKYVVLALGVLDAVAAASEKKSGHDQD